MEVECIISLYAAALLLLLIIYLMRACPCVPSMVTASSFSLWPGAAVDLVVKEGSELPSQLMAQLYY
jgi:hypothetical protein